MATHPFFWNAILSDGHRHGHIESSPIRYLALWSQLTWPDLFRSILNLQQQSLHRGWRFQRALAGNNSISIILTSLVTLSFLKFHLYMVINNHPSILTSTSIVVASSLYHRVILSSSYHHLCCSRTKLRACHIDSDDYADYAKLKGLWIKIQIQIEIQIYIQIKIQIHIQRK